MTEREFNKVVEEQLDMCKDVLLHKSAEYATEKDRLHNFKIAANLQGVNVAQALGGMMSKHTVSVYDLIRQIDSSDFAPMGLWNEKITDSINYLLLLKAAIIEHYRDGRGGCD